MTQSPCRQPYEDSAMMLQQQHYQQPASGLQPPRAGRSRFSKALPSVPMPTDDLPALPAPYTQPTTSTPTAPLTPSAMTAAFPLPPPKDLPQLPQLSIPTNNTSAELAFNPANSPLPPLPSSKLTSSLPSASSTGPPKKMAIARKPVGKPPGSIATPVTATPTSMTVTPNSFELPALPVQRPPWSPPPKEELPPPPPPPSKEPVYEMSSAPPPPPSKEPVYEMSSMPPSPSYSLSSLLSAYSRSSDDLVLKSPVESSGSNTAMQIRDYDSYALPDSEVHQHTAAPAVPKSERPELPAPAPAPSTASTLTSVSAPLAAPEPIRKSLDKPLPGSPMVTASTFSLFPNSRKKPSQSENTLSKTMSSQASPVAVRKAAVAPAAPPPPPSKDDVFTTTSSSSTATSSEPTPRARKPSASQPHFQSPSSPPREKLPPAPNFPVLTPSPPQIWTRRAHKGSRELPHLKLDYSPGSTAATAPSGAPALVASTAPSAANATAASSISPATQQTPAKANPSLNAAPARANADLTASSLSKPLPIPQPSPSPPSQPVQPVQPLHHIQPTQLGTTGLPGRNVRPARSTNSEDDTQTMGSGGSKIQQIKNKLHVSRRSDDRPSSNNSESVSRPAANRPPTPEYQKEDVKSPAPETFVSPVSPASSPEPGKDSAPAIYKDLPPGPPHSGTQSDTKPIARKAVASPPGSALQNVKSLPELKQSAPIRLDEPPVPALSTERSPRHQSPTSAAPSGARRRGDSAGPSTRDGPVRPDLSQRPYPARHSAPDSDPRIVRSDSRGSMYKGRDGTLYPMMKQMKSPDPRAFSFPSQVLEPLPPGTVLKAAPLKESHMKCFQKHRFMKRMTNRHHPLSCQTCEREDSEDRFRCNFCGLRICESCRRGLDGYERDLVQFVASMNANATTSADNSGASRLSSPLQPSSAHGLNP